MAGDDMTVTYVCSAVFEIGLDANILLYAYDGSARYHERARDWLEQVLSSGKAVGIPWRTVAAFVRVVTHPRLTGAKFTREEAVAVVDRWMAQPNVRLLAPGEEYWGLRRRMIVDGQARGALISDAELAALTMECGGILCTTDRGFARFPGLRWSNPLG